MKIFWLCIFVWILSGVVFDYSKQCDVFFEVEQSE